MLSDESQTGRSNLNNPHLDVTTKAMDHLPEELLCRFAQEMRPLELANLVLVNKKFCRIATPLLYSNCIFSELSHNNRL